MSNCEFPVMVVIFWHGRFANLLAVCCYKFSIKCDKKDCGYFLFNRFTKKKQDLRFLKLFEKFWSCKCSRLWKKFWLRHFGRSIYSKSILFWYWWHWFECCWFLIEWMFGGHFLTKYVLMFLVILILSQIFDWKNFWRTTIFSCGQFMVRAVIEVVDSDGVDLT